MARERHGEVAGAAAEVEQAAARQSGRDGEPVEQLVGVAGPEAGIEASGAAKHDRMVCGRASDGLACTPVARDDWRLRIELATEEAGGLLRRLGLMSSDAERLADELRERRLAVTADDGTVFVYAGSSLELERAGEVILAELDELGIRPAAVRREHWLTVEERWDDEPPHADSELVAEGYAPWEVRIPCPTHRQAQRLAQQLESEGYGVVRRWRYVIAGCATREDAEALARRLHGQVEAGGELVWEVVPGNPFAVFGGLG